MPTVIEEIKKLSDVPDSGADFDTWLQATDAISFLKNNEQRDEFVVYAGTAHVFLHAVTVPLTSVTPPDIDDLLNWNCGVGSGWSVWYHHSDPPSVSIACPPDNTSSKTIDKGEALLFSRFFEGRRGGKSYYEILQKFTQIFGLHFIPERNAYCRLDSRGDLEDLIRIVSIPAIKDRLSGTTVTFSRDLLEAWMALTDSAIVRMFDFTRYRPSHFGGWGNKGEPKKVTASDLFYRIVVEPGHGSYTRGVQIVRPKISREQAYDSLGYMPKEEKRYVSFVAHDWKNNVLQEISCAPGETANYFTKSDLPFEVSPAFFRPEVLIKYKADSDKYQLDGRSISCRGTWSLKTYDINEAGQVHTYICYLRDLPYEEQLHWKAYNEEPKAPISKRAFKTDFEGDWDLEYDALESIKGTARRWSKENVPFWSLRSEAALDRVHYPVTTSADEWANELLHLDQMVIEGFEHKWLKQKAIDLKRVPEVNWLSLKLLEACLIGFKFEEDHAEKIMAPLRELRFLRTKLKGHVAGAEAEEIKSEALSKYGTYTKHFKSLCANCDESLKVISEAFGFKEASM